MSVEFNKHIIELTPNDFDEIESWKLKKGKTRVSPCCIVLFYVNWCPHCQKTKPIWNELGKTAAFFDVASFDCEKYAEHTTKMKSDVENFIQGYPTIIVYSKGEPVHVYKEERSVDKLLKTCMDACDLKEN